MVDWSTLREDFPVLKEVVYLDSAASCLTPIPVLDAIMEYYTKYRANVHRGAHRLSVKASDKYDEARASVSRFIGADDPVEIIFTKNTTDGLNMAANGLRLRSGDKVVLTSLEHHSNLMPWQVLHHRHNVDLAFLETDEQGRFDLEKAADVIDENTAVVSFTHGSNVLGTLCPVKEIAKLAHDVGALVCVDAAQTVGHLPVDVDELGVDIMSFSGHKGPLGPTGIGVLYVRGEHLEKLNPVSLGGGTVKDVETGGFTLLGSPDRFEAGTPNIGGAIGLGAAVEYVTRIGTENIEQRERTLLTTMLKGLLDIDKLIVYGPKEPKLKTGVVSFNVEGINPHDVAIILDEMDAIAVRSGHHCAIPLVKRLGAPDGTVRASLGCYNNEKDVDTFLSRVSDVARGLA